MSILGSQSGVLVLLSGGLDSAACVAFFRRQGLLVKALFVDYGQVSRTRESASACAIAGHFQIPLFEVRCAGVRPKGAGCLAGRNAFFICLALMETKMQSGILSLGLHAGTDYWDCSAPFADTAQALLDGYTHGKIRLSLPFLEWTKRDIWDFCLTSDVPVDLTYSCELGHEQPCGCCLSCRDREALRAG